MVVFLIVFIIAGLVAANTMGVTEALTFLYLLKWCDGLFLTRLPCLATMWDTEIEYTTMEKQK